MDEAIRFYADHQFPLPVVKALRQAGLDVLTAAEAGLAAADDHQQLAFATTEGRVLLTHDADFIALHHASSGHAGIIYGHQRLANRRKIEIISLAFRVMTAQDMRNRLEFM